MINACFVIYADGEEQSSDGNDVIACDPIGTGRDDEIEELKYENETFKKMLIAVMDEDPEELYKILKRNEKFVKVRNAMRVDWGLDFT